jgi:hypothetical protein
MSRGHSQAKNGSSCASGWLVATTIHQLSTTDLASQELTIDSVSEVWGLIKVLIDPSKQREKSRAQ